MDNLMERMLMVKAMDYIARQLNNENHLMTWLEIGVADEDIPYGQLSLNWDLEKDPAFWYAEDKDRFGELMGDFLKIMARAYKNGGLYCGDVSSKEDPPKEKPFGVVKLQNADIEEALVQKGYPVTEKNIETVRYACENDHHLTDRMIEACWDTLFYHIDEVEDELDNFPGDYDIPDDDNLEMGFDPYMGCYTNDC